MTGLFRSAFGVLAVLVIGCGGSTPPPEEPMPPEPAADMPSETPKPAADEAAASEKTEGSEDSKPKGEPAAEPQFAENASVDEAIKAIPPGQDRVNIDNETMAKPLQEGDGGAFAACKATGKFKLRVAVWNSKAVGIDVDTTPKNPKLAECIKTRVKELTWKPAVRSLNTVEYAQ